MAAVDHRGVPVDRTGRVEGLQQPRKPVAGCFQFEEAISGMRAHHAREIRTQRQRIARIKDQQERLLDAFLDGALPKRILQEKQTRLEAELAQAEHLLAVAEQDGLALSRVLNEALDLAQNCERAYTLASETTRRQLNQALFEHFEIGDDGLPEAPLREEFRSLTARDTPRRLRAEPRTVASSGLGSNKTLLAEGEGFEPSSEENPPKRFSRPPHSTALPPLRTRGRGGQQGSAARRRAAPGRTDAPVVDGDRGVGGLPSAKSRFRCPRGMNASGAPRLVASQRRPAKKARSSAAPSSASSPPATSGR